jgi:hypothetical protein
MRELLGYTAARITREGAIQITAIHGRHPRAAGRGGEVQARYDDQLALYIRGLDGAGYPRGDDLSFEFVPVSATGEQNRGPVTVLDHNDRDAHVPVGRAVNRMGNEQMIDTLAIGVEIDVAPALTSQGHAAS